MGIEDMRSAALQSLESAGTHSDDGVWHKWADDSELDGFYVTTERFTRKDGTEAVYARIDTDNGPVKMGLDYAVLRSEWDRCDPQPGDRVMVIRGSEKKQSSNGREFWPFGVAVEKTSNQVSKAVEQVQQQLGAVVLMEDQVKRNDPDNPDDIPF